MWIRPWLPCCVLKLKNMYSITPSYPKHSSLSLSLSLQVAGCLSQAGDSVEICEKLVELVASADYGFLHLFSKRQLQV
jgi:hypothetical protein